jgi:hypothetical protein
VSARLIVNTTLGPGIAISTNDVRAKANYMRATPATPPASAQFPDQLVRSNHVVYARRVLEAAARYMVVVAGSRIQEAAEHSREYPDLGAGALAATLAHTQQRLAMLGERLRHAQGSPGALLTAALGGPVPDTLPADVPELVSGGIGTGPGAPPLTTRAVIEAEREVLTACRPTRPPGPRCWVG